MSDSSTPTSSRVGNDTTLAGATTTGPQPESPATNKETLAPQAEKDSRTVTTSMESLATRSNADEGQALQEAEPVAKENSSGNKSRRSKNRTSAAAKARKRKARARKSSATRSTGADSAAEEAQDLPQEPKEWVTPLPLATCSLPKLDCAKLPPVLGDFCSGLARELQVPEELVLTNALGIMATCAQSTYSVKLYGTNTQPTNLFLMCPMPSASRKRMVQKACTSPLAHWENEQIREIGPQIESENIYRMITKRAIRQLTKDAVQAQMKEDNESVDKLVVRICRLESRLMGASVLPRLVTDTLAGLEKNMHEQHDTLSLASSEDNCLDTLSSASSRSARELVLKGWDASQHTVDKKSAHYCMRPRLTMTLAPRADILADPAKARLLQSRKLASRFIYLMPETGAYSLAKGVQMPEEVANAFFEKVLRILPASWNKPGEQVTLTLSEEAQKLWLEYQDKAERLCLEGELATGLQEWTTRFAGNVVGRIAALFHLLTCADPKSDLVISAEQMGQALSLGDLLFEHARVAWGTLLKDTQAEATHRVLDVVTSNSWNIFSARECFQALKGQALFRTMKPLNAALETLALHGYIRTVTVKSRNGRQVLRYELNPALVTWQNSETSVGEATEREAFASGDTDAAAAPAEAASTARTSEDEFLVRDILQDAGVEGSAASVAPDTDQE